MSNQNSIKICFISSSGGHYEQLRMLIPLSEKYKTIWITENADYDSPADYLLSQTRPNKIKNMLIMSGNFIRSFKIWVKEKPDYVVTTGTLAALPMCVFAKIFRKKLIYIESFARVYDGTKAGKFMYKFSDLFIIQWKTLQEVYPKSIYGGSIY